jgi:hypothetical protein
MNSKSLQNNDIVNSRLEKLATAQTSFITGIIRKVFDSLTRSEIEKTQASYKMKRKHETQAELQDIIHSLPIEEKLRLGMYHLMD